MNRDEKLATAFNAISHPRRVRIFRLLAETPEAGRTFAGIQLATGYNEAPLLHHLQVMESAGLIRRQRVGATVARVLTPGPVTDAIEQASRVVSSAQRSKLKAV